MEGCDYSYARPSAQCLYNAGHRFVVRYVGPNTDSGKWLRSGELAALRSAGLLVCLVYQTTASFMLNGREEGVRAGQRSIAMADGLGIRGRPFYYALDTDTSPFGTSQWNAVKAFLDGAASVTGRARVGIYGDDTAMNVLVPTWAPYGWQTYAWSGGRLSSKAALYQYRNGVNMCGGAVDLCRSLKPDFGQWPSSVVAPPPEPPKEWDEMATKAEVQAAVQDALTANPELNRLVNRLDVVYDAYRMKASNPDLAWTGNLPGRVDVLYAERGGDDVDEAAIAAQVLAGLPAEAIAAAIPLTVADDVAANLAARLAG